jgi:P27 family predicted phage terminase small subunit
VAIAFSEMLVRLCVTESFWILKPGDLAGLERWIVSVDEWARAMRALRRQRIVEGSTGQPALNPLASYVASREAAIMDAEEKYGMTPMGRLKLGIAVGQAKLTAAELNRALEDGNRDDGGAGDREEA